VPRAQLARGAQELGTAPHQVHVAGDRFHDDRGNLRPVLAERVLQLLAVVVTEHHRLAGNVGRHAGRTGVTERERAGAGLDQQTVGVPVVAAFEFDDPVPPGGPARQPDGAHGGLRAGRDQPHLLYGRHPPHDPLGQVDLGLGRGAEGQAVGGRRLDGLDHGRVGVAQDHGPP
jgi:hypothetical protein